MNKKYTVYKGEEFIPAGPITVKNTVVWGSGIIATESNSFFFGDGVSGAQLQFREIMQDYHALGYSDLLDHATALLNKEIRLRREEILKKYCS